MRRKVFTILLVLIFTFIPVAALADGFVTLPPSASSTTSPPSINAEGAMLVDLDTNTILYSKNADAQCYPASLTKMMTLLISFENCKDPNTETITVPKESLELPADSSLAYIQTGDIITVEDMFYAMMLPSGNDAAVALAMHFGTSISGFVDMMNKKAQELNMTGTHFENPDGLHSAQHYTTPRDLATLSIELTKHPELIAVTSATSYSVHATRGGQQIEWKVLNTNGMINSTNTEYLAGVKGLKTGYTIPAGNCLATYYEKNGRRMVCVITKTGANHDRSDDTKKLYAYGLDNFSTLNLTDVFSNRTYIVKVDNYATDDEFNGQLELYLTKGDPVYYTTSKQLANKIIGGTDPLMVQMPAGLIAPVSIGAVAGTITFSINGEQLYVAQAKASRTIEANIIIPPDLTPIDGISKSHTFDFIKQPKVYIPIIVVFALTILIYGVYLVRRRRNRRIIHRQCNVFGRTRYKRK